MTFLRTVWLGMPVWVWLLLVLAGGINEVILRSKWTEAKSTWQGLWRTILWIPAFGPFMARFPWIGPLLKRFAGIEEPGLPLPMPPKEPAPTPPPAAALLPFILTLFVVGCGAAGQAWTRCQLGMLPQTSQGALSCVTGALGSQGDWQSAVTACIGALIPSQFNCLIAAIAAGSGGDKVSPDGVKSPVKERAEIWLNAHGGVPKACAETTRL